jgi:hypothetical protein
LLTPCSPAKFENTIRQLASALEGTQDQLAEAVKEIELLKQRARKKNRNAEDVNLDLGLNIEYDPVNLNCKGTFTGHTGIIKQTNSITSNNFLSLGPVWSLALTKDGLLVSASSDMTIKVNVPLFIVIYRSFLRILDMGCGQFQM